MNILALETSMGACSAAMLSVGGGDARNLVARQESMQRGHAEALMPMVAEVMAEAGIAPSVLDVIAATTGPGSFTGVRIAIAAARGLALVTNASLFGADSLTVMARVARDSGAVGASPFAVAVDAHRGMLYFALFDADGERREGPLLVAPGDAATSLPRDVSYAVGSGALLLAAAAERHQRQIEVKLPELQPSAAALAEIVLASGKHVAVLRPLYLRPPDARPQAPAVARR
jgi:tRNA threonylcarbamoyl adenosine modification protein YeaZ